MDEEELEAEEPQIVVVPRSKSSSAPEPAKEKADPALLTKTLATAALWIGLNLSLAMTNKWLFQYREFEYPIFIIMTGIFTTFITSSIAIFWLKIDQFSDWSIIKNNLMLLTFMALSHGLSTAFENISIQRTTISFNQIIKATTPLLTLSFGYFIEKRRYYPQAVTATLVIALGAVFSTFKVPAFDMIGFLCSLASEFLATVRTICSAILLQKAKISPFSLITLVSLPASFSILPLFLVYEYSGLVNFLKTNENALGDLITVIVINWTAVVYNFTTLILLRYTSAHYFTVIANTKSVMLIVVSMYIFHVHVTKLNAIGMLISLSGFCAYTYFRYINKEERKEPTETNL